MPIETAPKDGSEVLACWPDRNLRAKWAFMVLWWDGEQWLTAFDHVQGYTPTHYQPLPKSPA